MCGYKIIPIFPNSFLISTCCACLRGDEGEGSGGDKVGLVCPRPPGSVTWVSHGVATWHLLGLDIFPAFLHLPLPPFTIPHEVEGCIDDVEAMWVGGGPCGVEG